MSGDDIFQVEPEPSQPKKSGGSKLLLGLGIGCGVVVLLCCGGVFAVVYYFQGMFSEDPVVVRSNTQKITEIEIPADMEPTASMDIQIPFKGRMMTVVVYSTPEAETTDQPRGMLIMAEFDAGMMTTADREEMASQVRNSLKQQGQQQQEDIEINESEQIELTIRDQPAEFVIARGMGKESQVEMWQVTGTFEGKGGPAFLMFLIEADQMSKEEIVDLLNSIQ